MYLVNRRATGPRRRGGGAVSTRRPRCVAAGFRRITLRGDTDFTQTGIWTGGMSSVRFVFGCDARANLVERAEALPAREWTPTGTASGERDPDASRASAPGEREGRKVVEREFENLRLRSEDVAEFAYQPTACAKTYRWWWCERTSRWSRVISGCSMRFGTSSTSRMTETPAAEIVFLANERCNQENLIEQLKNGCRRCACPWTTC